ncbi:MAG: protein kinase [Acidobacteria bacterium]|nr:protein kinase [Acidobacteriota bacterium]
MTAAGAQAAARGAPGRILSHYRLGERLGAGGMGEVFRAEDLALGRAAAVKILPFSLAPEARARLLREGEASARLQHPAIATFYEAGEDAGAVYLAMELVPGETLRQRLQRGPLARGEFHAVAGCLLEALVHAHAAGVLHRDIKPENVMLTADGLAKLLDFGIARLLTGGEGDAEEKTAIALTGASGVVGTLGYMSPEQLSGKVVDARSDVFSLGAVLCEALSGRPAFPGESVAERIVAILHAEPRMELGEGAPRGLHPVLARALAKDREARYPSAAAMLSDLRALSAGELVAALPDSLAVVDFRNLSRNPDDDWIGSGLAESLRGDLLRLPGVSVAAREKLRELGSPRGGAVSEEEEVALGRRLGCRWVVSGSYERTATELRVAARLVEVATGAEVAGERLTGALEEIFRLQDRLSTAIARVLRRSTESAPVLRPAPKIDAYELHARGRLAFEQLAKGSLDRAGELYEQAIGVDPRYAPALAGLAAVHGMRFTFRTDAEELATAAGYARRAIAADPELAEPRIWLGYALLRQGDFAAGLAEERRAMELDPTSVTAAYFGGCCAALPGDHREGLALFRRVLELEPRHGWAWLGLGWSHLELGANAEARWCLEKAVELERRGSPHPTAGVSGYLGECLRRLDDLDSARRHCLDGLQAVERSDNMYRDTVRGVCLCALGRTALAQGDTAAAHAAFVQAIAHLRGRPRGLGGGYLLVQALAGLARAGDGEEPYEAARSLFDSRHGHDFSLMWTCTEDATLLDLARAAAALGRREEAAALFARARAAGSGEALRLAAP